jgi:hypothetical protein
VDDSSSWVCRFEFGLCALSSTSFAVAFKDNNNSGKGAVRVGTISGGSISLGSTYYFNTGQTNHISIDALDSGTIAISYKDDSNSNRGTSIIGSISGTAVTYHSESVYNTGNTEWINTIALSSTSFVVVYSDLGNNNYGTSCIGTINSSNAISFGSEFVFNSANTTNLVAAGHGSNNFTMSYSDGGNGNNLNANVGTISGSSISFGSEVTLNGNVQVPATAAIGLDYFVTIYKDDPSGGVSTAVAAYVAGILPVELLYFNAHKNTVSVELAWETASEFNNRGFTVQRSVNGLDWLDLAFVEGAGSVQQNRYYRWIDESPNQGINYYRLIQIDFDGAKTYTDLESIDWGDYPTVEVFPNPVKENFQLRTKGVYPQALKLYDSEGRFVRSLERHSDYVDTADLKPGCYLLIVQFEHRVDQLRIVKQ